ncbi:MAG: arginine--tRNA ligase, partial [Clostridia bacterium]|nr:arginine--tRNA ligase [Clostridia bacterium]
VGAIVFYYLSNNRIKDINFNLEEALSFDGNTGPYVQYTYARTCSVLEKAGDVTCGKVEITAPEEAALLKTLCQYEEKVNNAIRDYEPSVITRFILDIAVAFNKFYHECKILGADDENVKATRIMLTEATKHVLGSAFSLICLKKTERI